MLKLCYDLRKAVAMMAQPFLDIVVATVASFVPLSNVVRHEEEEDEANQGYGKDLLML